MAATGVVIDVFYVGGRHREPHAVPRSNEQVAAELQGLQRRRAQDAAREAELIMALAGTRPASRRPRLPSSCEYSPGKLDRPIPGTAKARRLPAARHLTRDRHFRFARTGSGRHAVMVVLATTHDPER